MAKVGRGCRSHWHTHRNYRVCFYDLCTCFQCKRELRKISSLKVLAFFTPICSRLLFFAFSRLRTSIILRSDTFWQKIFRLRSVAFFYFFMPVHSRAVLRSKKVSSWQIGIKKHATNCICKTNRVFICQCMILIVWSFLLQTLVNERLFSWKKNKKTNQKIVWNVSNPTSTWELLDTVVPMCSCLLFDKKYGQIN